jgi:hypothetical protein
VSTDFNAVGSYVMAYLEPSSVSAASGSTFAAGTGSNQVQSLSLFFGGGCSIDVRFNSKTNNLSGTWRMMNGTLGSAGQGYSVLCVRIA